MYFCTSKLKYKTSLGDSRHKWVNDDGDDLVFYIPFNIYLSNIETIES